MRKIIFILGTAGSGKTTLSYLLRKSLQDSILINLDPANINAKADLDIRYYVKTENIMKNYNLGPNGAILKSMELSLNYIDNLIEKIPENVYYILIDTPGQLEIFLYRDIGRIVVEKFRKLGEPLGIFLVDIRDALIPENLLSILAWNMIIHLRLTLQTLTVINKVDTVSKDKIKELVAMIKTKKVIKDLLNKNDNLSYLIAKSFEEFYEYSTLYKRPIFISAKSGEGITELVSAIFDLLCTCGDIT